MEKAGISIRKFIAGIVIAILASTAISVIISTRLLTGGLYAPNYDSGWVDISNKTGKYFNITHNMNSEDGIVDIRGKTTASGGANQRYIGLISGALWTRTYGGTGDDFVNSVVRADDGGYALAGGTWSYGGPTEAFWLVKTDSAGNQLWNKTYGGDNDECYSMVQTSDGGYALAGRTHLGNSDFWLVKTDSTGYMEWNKFYGGTGSDEANSLIQTSDGGYALAGQTVSYGANYIAIDYYLVKTDASGNMQWNKTYGGGNWDRARSMIQTSDGGYALAGDTGFYSADDSDIWLVKTDSFGNQLWNRTYGGAGDDECSSIVQTQDGGYAFAGFTYSSGAGLADIWLVKTGSSGAAQWNKTYGGTHYDGSYCVLQTPDGGYALAGDTESFGAGDGDFWLVKTDSTGNMQWNKTYGGTGDERAKSMVQIGDGGYAFVGYTDSFGAGSGDFWLVKTEVESGLTWTDSAPNTITLYRGATDVNWNYVRVRIWKID